MCKYNDNIKVSKQKFGTISIFARIMVKHSVSIDCTKRAYTLLNTSMT